MLVIGSTLSMVWPTERLSGFADFQGPLNCDEQPLSSQKHLQPPAEIQPPSKARATLSRGTAPSRGVRATLLRDPAPSRRARATLSRDLAPSRGARATLSRDPAPSRGFPYRVTLSPASGVCSNGCTTREYLSTTPGNYPDTQDLDQAADNTDTC